MKLRIMGGIGIGIVVGLLLLGAAAPATALTTEALLDTLQHTAFDFFWNEANPANGLIKDRNATWAPCSIASTGFGLSAICVGIDHGWVSRADGANRVLTTLNTFWTKPQGSSASGTIGYQGLFYHFLDMDTGTRTWDCELSTIDTALLFAGIIDARQYFSTTDTLDVQIRALADSITSRANWEFVRNFSPGIYMGWKPGTGFSGFGLWTGYNEAMILYILALGSPTHAVPASAWTTWTSGYSWQTHYGYSYVNFPPLFGHQYSHCWVDFRNIKDAYMDAKGITYFENSRRATLAAREYCIANPGGFTGYGTNGWGLTACDGPFGYSAHGAPPAQNDDGTIAPTAAAGSIAFAPEVVIPTLHYYYDTLGPALWSTYGFLDSFNMTQFYWATDYIGIDEGPIILMIENYRTGAVWERFMQNSDVQQGLQQAGFVPVVGVGDDFAGGVRDGVLLKNVPNPFRSSSVISFHLDEPGDVSLTLYDVAGRQVRSIAHGTKGAGDHAVELEGRGLPNGIYLYQLEVNGRRYANRCLLLR